MASIWMELINPETGRLETRMIRYLPEAEYIARLLVPLMRNHTIWVLLDRLAYALEQSTMASRSDQTSGRSNVGQCVQGFGRSVSSHQEGLEMRNRSCHAGVGSEISLENV